MSQDTPDESTHRRSARTLLRLRELISAGRYNVEGLAEKLREEGFAASARSVHRRLDDLRQMGDRFEFDARRKVYHYPKNASPANMALPDATKKAVGTLRGLARSVSPQLLAMVDESLELFVPQLTQGQLPISVQAEGVFLTEETRAQYELVARAEQQRQVIEFTYRDSKGVTTHRRQAEPYGFIVSQAQMFILARDRRKRAMRTFSLEQMSDVNLLPSTFVKPADFDIAEYGRNSPSGLFDGPPFEAKVRFSARVAAYAKRTRLGRTAKQIEELFTTEAVLTLTVADADELLRWVLSFGRDAELVAPADLRATLADLAASIAAVHRTSL